MRILRLGLGLWVLLLIAGPVLAQADQRRLRSQGAFL